MRHAAIGRESGSAWRPYLAVLSARARVLLQYRAAAFAAFGTRFFWGLIRLMIYEAFYRSSTAAHPLSFPQMVTYIWLGQAMLALTLGAVDADVRTMVRTGTVAYELLRPADLYGIWYARSLASRAIPTAMQAVPVVLAGALCGMHPPATPLAGAGFAASVGLALLLGAAVAALITVTLVVTVSSDGIVRLMPILMYGLSGMIIPISLFPGWLQPLLLALPFPGLIDFPFRIYLGQASPEQIPLLLLHQLAWTGVLILVGRTLLSRVLRRMVVQGG